MAIAYEPAVFQKKVGAMLAQTYDNPKWDALTELPDLTGKVAVVTGANDFEGIGFVISQTLSQKGAKVYVAARNSEKAESAISEIKRQAGSQSLPLAPLAIDYESFAQVKEGAKKVLASETRLDIVVHNAAALAQPLRLIENGVSQSVVVNHLSPFLLTSLLLPLLKKTATQSPGVRIVFVSSIAHKMTPKGLPLNTIEDLNTAMGGPEDMMGNLNRYALGKLLNILFAKELQARLNSEGVEVLATAVHPGNVWTGQSRRSIGGNAELEAMVKKTAITPEEGALTPLFAAAHPKAWTEKAQYAGAFIVPYGVVDTPHENALNSDLAKSLWKLSEEIVAPYLS